MPGWPTGPRSKVWSFVGRVGEVRKHFASPVPGLCPVQALADFRKTIAEAGIAVFPTFQEGAQAIRRVRDFYRSREAAGNPVTA